MKLKLVEVQIKRIPGCYSSGGRSLDYLVAVNPSWKKKARPKTRDSNELSNNNVWYAAGSIFVGIKWGSMRERGMQAFGLS